MTKVKIAAAIAAAILVLETATGFLRQVLPFFE